MKLKLMIALNFTLLEIQNIMRLKQHHQQINKKTVISHICDTNICITDIVCNNLWISANIKIK